MAQNGVNNNNNIINPNNNNNNMTAGMYPSSSGLNASMMPSAGHYSDMQTLMQNMEMLAGWLKQNRDEWSAVQEGLARVEEMRGKCDDVPDATSLLAEESVLGLCMSFLSLSPTYSILIRRSHSVMDHFDPDSHYPLFRNLIYPMVSHNPSMDHDSSHSSQDEDKALRVPPEKIHKLATDIDKLHD